jgi:hypothetical protein
MDLVQEAGFPQSPVAVHAKNLRRIAVGCRVADLANQLPPVEFVQEDRFVVAELQFHGVSFPPAKVPGAE